MQYIHMGIFWQHSNTLIMNDKMNGVGQLHPSAGCQLRVLSTPKRVLFTHQGVVFFFMPNNSPILKSTLLLVKVLRLFHLSLVFPWSACCCCWCSYLVMSVADMGDTWYHIVLLALLSAYLRMLRAWELDRHWFERANPLNNTHTIILLYIV